MLSAGRLALLLALVFAIATAVRDATLVRVFGFYVTPDSGGYLLGLSIRSRPYPILIWLTDASQHPLVLIALQILLAGLATAAMVYVVGRRNPWLAALIGLLFALDMDWSLWNRYLMTEGPFMSFSVLSLALLIHQYEERDRLHPAWLVAAGVLFAWTCTIRPSNLYLLVPIVVLYLLFTRSLRKSAWLAAGMAALLVATCSLTWYQFGRFRINAGTGYYLAFPLFAYHLFSGGNGPASARIDHTLRICDPSVDYSQVTIETSNKYLWGEFFGCLYTHGWSDDQIDSGMTAAYLEGIRARPGTWLYNWLGYSLIELGYPVVYEGESPPGGCPVAVVKVCTDLAAYDRNLPATSGSVVAWETAWEHRTAPARQVYLLPFQVRQPSVFGNPYGVMEQHALSTSYVLIVLLLLLGTLGLLWFRTRGSPRLLALSAAFFIGYVCLTIPAGHVFLARYIEPLSPIYAVLSAVVIFAILRLGAVVLGGQAVLVALLATLPITAALYLLVPPPVLDLALPGSVHTLNLPGPYGQEGGSAFSAQLPDRAGIADTTAAPLQSTLRVYEDGHALGPAHATQAAVRDVGRGRFGHAGTGVIFSTSDNSDPNLNGRRYTATYLVQPSSTQRLAGYALAALILTGLGALAYRRRRRDRGGTPPRLGLPSAWTWPRSLDEAGV